MVVGITLPPRPEPKTNFDTIFSFTNLPTLPGNPNIHNYSTSTSVVTGARVCDVIPRVRRSDETRVLPDYFHHAPHFQRFFRTQVTRARQNPMLLRYPPEPPRLSNHISITLSRTR